MCSAVGSKFHKKNLTCSATLALFLGRLKVSCFRKPTVKHLRLLFQKASGWKYSIPTEGDLQKDPSPFGSMDSKCQTNSFHVSKSILLLDPFVWKWNGFILRVLWTHWSSAITAHGSWIWPCYLQAYRFHQCQTPDLDKP